MKAGIELCPSEDLSWIRGVQMSSLRSAKAKDCSVQLSRHSDLDEQQLNSGEFKACASDDNLQHKL